MKAIHPLLLLFLTMTLPFLNLGAEKPGSEGPAELRERDGLPNFFHKLKKGEDVTIAYLGGSITAQNGWRVQSLEWFREQFPEATIEQIPAAIGGTGSDLGVFRLEKDALRHEPDLLFVEFAVNDSGAQPVNIIKAMEGIVRKTRASYPDTDICFVYTITFRDSQQLAAGQLKRSTRTMEQVADHYGIPSIHLGYQAALLEREDKLVMKTDAPMTRVSGDELNEAAALATDKEGRIIFSKDGVHPYTETGHVLYTQALIRAMQEMRSDAIPVRYSLPEPIREDNWEAAQFVPITEDMISGSYKNLDESDQNRFKHRMSPLYRLEPGATLSFRFKGTKVSIYDLLGPDSGRVEISLDGKIKTKERIDGYSTYQRLATLYVADGLEDAVHEVKIRVLDEPIDKSEILFERNRDDLIKNPEKYAPLYWYPGAIFIVGEMFQQ